MKSGAIAAFSVIALSLIGASQSLAAESYEIYTYGSGDFVAQVFTGVALLFSGNYIEMLVKVIVLIGLLTALLNPITSWLSRGSMSPLTGGEGFIAILRQSLLAAVVVYVFILPKANLAIIDRLDPAQSQVVSDIPFVQVIIAYGAATIGDVIGREMETAFTLPDALKFRNGGLGVGIKQINTLFNVQPPSSTTFSSTGVSSGSLIALSLREYFNQCVFKNFAILDGAAGAKSAALYALMNSTDVIATLESHAALFGDPNIPIPVPTADGLGSCDTAIPAIKIAWTTIKNPWLAEIEKNTNGGVTETILSHYFPDGGDPFVMLQTIATGNVLRDAALNYGVRSGTDPNAISLEMAQKGTVGGWQTTAAMFEKISNIMRNVFEGLVYGLSVLLPVAVAVAGLSPMGTYLKIVLWLQLWVPFYVLLNLFGDMEMARALNTLAQQSGGTFISLSQWQNVGDTAKTSLAYLGSLAFTVPMFAWGLLKGGEYAMSSAIQGMTGGGGAAMTAASIGSSTAQGNISMGNRSVDNSSYRSSTTAGSDLGFEMGAGQTTARSSLGNVSGFSSAVEGSRLRTSAGMVEGMGGREFFKAKTDAEFGVGNALGTQALADRYGGGNVADSARTERTMNGTPAFALNETLALRGGNIHEQAATEAGKRVGTAEGDRLTAAGAGKTVPDMASQNAQVAGAKNPAMFDALSKNGLTPTSAAKADAQAGAAKSLANSTVSQGDHNLTQDTGLHRNVGEAKATSSFASNNKTDVENLTRTAKDFDWMKTKGAIDGTKALASGMGMSTEGLLEAKSRTGRFATNDGLVNASVGKNGKVSQQMTQRGRGTEIHDNSTRTTVGHDTSLPTTEMKGAAFGGSVGKAIQNMGENRFWNNKDVGNAAVTDFIRTGEMQINQSKSFTNMSSLGNSATLAGSIDSSRTIAGKVIGAASGLGASLSGEVHTKSEAIGKDDTKVNLFAQGVKGDYVSISNDAKLSTAQKTERFEKAYQERMREAGIVTESSNFGNAFDQKVTKPIEGLVQKFRDF